MCMLAIKWISSFMKNSSWFSFIEFPEQISNLIIFIAKIITKQMGIRLRLYARDILLQILY